MGESSQIRSELAKNANSYLSKYFEKLNTPTIKISNREEYDSFLNKNLYLMFYFVTITHF